METITTFRFIKVYCFEVDRLKIRHNDLIDSLIIEPTRKSRIRRFVQHSRVLGEWGPPFFKVVAPNSVEKLTGLGPMLSQLPGEIRNIIYSYLLSTGHLQFLRASKALYVEGIGLMAENGVYRVGFRTDERINYILPSQQIVDTIQNLDIRADLRCSEACSWTVIVPRSTWLIEAFGEPGRPRGQCSVTLAVDRSTKRAILAGICRRLRLFSDFKTVVVRAEVDWPSPASLSTDDVFDSLMAEADKAWLEQPETAVVPWSIFVCRFVYNHDYLVSLRRYLGEGLLKGQDEGSFRLVFHPRKAQEGLGRGSTN